MQTSASPQRGSKLPFTAALLSTLVLACVFGVGGLLWLLWLFAGGAGDTWAEMGWWGYAVVLATGLAVAAGLGALVLRGWKPRLPAAVFLALGLLPWLVGALGTRSGVRMCTDAILQVNPVHKATILTNGFGEAFASYLFGGGLSAVLLLGLALGLGTAALLLALGRRGRTADAPSFDVTPAASAALLCLAAALAVASCLPRAYIHRDIFYSMASVNPVDRPTLVASAVQSLGPARVATGLMLGAALVLTLGAALWARRAGVGRGRALAAGLCVVPAFAMHGLVLVDMKEAARLTLETPWASAGDFQPVTVPGLTAYQETARGVVTRTHLVPPRGQQGVQVPLAGALAPALRELMDPRHLSRAESEDTEGLAEPSLRPSLELAVDSRLDGAKLRVLLEAAHTAGAHSLFFVGQSPSFPARAQLESEPLLAPFLREVRSTSPVALLSALPRPYPGGLHGRLGAASVLSLTPTPDSGEEPLTVDLAQPQPEGEPVYGEQQQVPVYLLVEADVTAEQLVQAVEAVAHRSTARRMLLPVLLTAPLPPSAAPVANDGPQ